MACEACGLVDRPWQHNKGTRVVAQQHIGRMLSNVWMLEGSMYVTLAGSVRKYSLPQRHTKYSVCKGTSAIAALG